MAHRLSPEAEADLDEIWYYIATHSGSVETADRFVDSVTARFSLLAEYPIAGRRRDHDLRPGVRTFPVGEYVIAYRIDGDDVLIQRVVRGSRDIETLFGD
jgi:toxin ParE1/3/4